MNDAIQINPEGCPVCGFQEITALDNSGCTTFEICPSCGCEAGYAYGKTVSQTHLSKLREDWLIGKAGKWQSSTLTYDKEPKNARSYEWILPYRADFDVRRAEKVIF